MTWQNISRRIQYVIFVSLSGSASIFWNHIVSHKKTIWLNLKARCEKHTDKVVVTTFMKKNKMSISSTYTMSKQFSIFHSNVARWIVDSS